MGEHLLDMERYPRRAQFDYFRTLAYPYVGVTVNVDITDYLSGIKRRGAPSFLSFCWCAVRAANAVPAFRQRIRGEGIAEYNFCPGSVTLALPDESYCYCTLPEAERFEEWLPQAQAAKEAALSAASLSDGADGESLLFLSSLPWMSYTALVQPVPYPADSNPRISWGKYFTQEGRTLLPVSTLCNHALADAKQLAAFYEELERELAALS